MDTTDWSDGNTITAEQLPPTITRYLEAHLARDLGTAMPYYADDAAVTDEGHTYTGREQIREWLGHAATEYTYTVEFTSAQRFDNDHYDAVHHLEGDFPGGVADLHFRFTLRDQTITRLVIEP